MGRTVRKIALNDIVKDMKDQGIQTHDKFGDVWVVTAYRLNCVEQRQLNVDLGLNKLNYYGNKNGNKLK